MELSSLSLKSIPPYPVAFHDGNSQNSMFLGEHSLKHDFDQAILSQNVEHDLENKLTKFYYGSYWCVDVRLVY